MIIEGLRASSAAALWTQPGAQVSASKVLESLRAAPRAEALRARQAPAWQAIAYILAGPRRRSAVGQRSRERRARRAWIVPLLLPVLRPLGERITRMRAREAYRFATRLACLFRLVLRLIGDPLRRNLELACGGLPDARTLAAFERDYYLHLALLAVEFFRLPAITRADLGRSIESAGVERIREVYAAGEGVICVAGHAGVWELAGHVGGLAGLKITSVAKFAGHPLVDGWVLAHRQAGGQRVIDVRGSLWAMKKALDRGEAIGINVDQEARQNRVFAPFFGIPAATSTAPASLHLMTKAPIVVVTAHRTAPFRYRLEVLDVIRHAKTKDREGDLLAITSRINAALEQALRRYPVQWLWSHRRWRRRPEGEASPFARLSGSVPLRLSADPGSG